MGSSTNTGPAGAGRTLSLPSLPRPQALRPDRCPANPTYPGCLTEQQPPQPSGWARCPAPSARKHRTCRVAGTGTSDQWLGGHPGSSGDRSPGSQDVRPFEPPWGPHRPPRTGHLQQGAGSAPQKQDWGLSYLGILHRSHRVGEARACRHRRHTQRPWNTDLVTAAPTLLTTSEKPLPLKDTPIPVSAAPSPLYSALTSQAGHSIGSKDGRDFVARVHHTDAQLLTGHQQWGNVPTNQREEEPYTVGPQHGRHTLPTMLDACRVHLNPSRGRNKMVKELGQVRRGNPPPPGRRAEHVRGHRNLGVG